MTKSPIDQITRPVSRFIHLEYTSGLVLFLAVLVAILWVNSPLANWYHQIWSIEFGVGFGENEKLSHPLHEWINDGLMAIFFFVIGLELKREFIAGELSTGKKAALPIGAALGGMLVPALIYGLINKGTAGSSGWGIPMATDIAFALALLSMVGRSVPGSVKIFLSALAVADDLGAVLVIAFFYSTGLEMQPLLIGGIFLLGLVIGNALGIRHSAFYLILGMGVWSGFLLSGIHATIAGVLVAFTIPARRKVAEKKYALRLRELSDEFDREIPNCGTLTTPKQHELIERIKGLSLAAQTPLQKIESALHPWVAFIIMPLFALANSGVIIEQNFLNIFNNRISIGIIIGLVIGKFVGVFSFTWLLVKLKICNLPEKACWPHMFGVSVLAGVGFTMSLFVSSLAFENDLMLAQAKYGILIASFIAGSAGFILLKYLKSAETVKDF